MTDSRMSVAVRMYGCDAVQRDVGYVWPDPHVPGQWAAAWIGLDYLWEAPRVFSSLDVAIDAIMGHARIERGYEVPR